MLSAPDRSPWRWPAWIEGMRPRCDVCAQPLGTHGYYVQEEPDAPEPPEAPQSWTLCRECSQAVWRHVERMALPTPRRLRIAVGLVASERATPEAIRARAPNAVRDRRSERRMERMLIWLFAIFFLVHALVFILVVIEVAAR